MVQAVAGSSPVAHPKVFAATPRQGVVAGSGHADDVVGLRQTAIRVRFAKTATELNVDDVDARSAGRGSVITVPNALRSVRTVRKSATVQRLAGITSLRPAEIAS